MSAEAPAGLSERLRLAIAEEARRQRVSDLPVVPALSPWASPARRLALGGAALAAVLIAAFIFEQGAGVSPKTSPMVAVKPPVASSPVPGPVVAPGMKAPGTKPAIIASRPARKHTAVKPMVVAANPSNEDASASVVLENPRFVPLSKPSSLRRSAPTNASLKTGRRGNYPVRPTSRNRAFVAEKLPAKPDETRTMPNVLPVPLPDVSDNGTAAPASVAAQPATPTVQVASLTSTLKNLARSTQNDSGVGKISMAVAHTASYSGQLTIVGSAIR